MAVRAKQDAVLILDKETAATVRLATELRNAGIKVDVEIWVLYTLQYSCSACAIVHLERVMSRRVTVNSRCALGSTTRLELRARFLLCRSRCALAFPARAARSRLAAPTLRARIFFY